MASTAGPRLPINQDDQSGLIVIVAAVGITWTLSALAIRLLSKANIKTEFGFEEGGIVVSSCLAVASSIGVFVAVSYGFGKRIIFVSHDGGVVSASRAIYASELLYILALAFSKAAMVPLIKRLTPVRQHRYLCYALAAIVLAWAIASVFTIALRCDLSTPWLFKSTNQCSDLFPRWASIEGLSLLIECLIFAMALNIVRILQMRLKAKMKVMFAFFTRMPIIIPTVIRLFYLRRGLSSTDYTFSMTNALIATQCVLHYTVMATSFAYLKPFLSAFDSNLGATVKLDTAAGSYYLRGSKNKYNGSYMMNKMSNRSDVKMESGGREVAIETDHDARRKRESSQDSNAPIIVKTQSFQVHREQSDD